MKEVPARVMTLYILDTLGCSMAEFQNFQWAKDQVEVKAAHTGCRGTGHRTQSILGSSRQN